MKKYRFAAMLLVLALLLTSCGPHKKEAPRIPLNGLEKVSFVPNGDSYDLSIGGRQYKYIAAAFAKYIEFGDVIAYEIIEGNFYKYFAELSGNRDVIARFRPGSKGELPSGEDDVELYAAADLSELPDWAEQLRGYPLFDDDYIVGNLKFTAKYIRTEGSLPDKAFPYALLIDDRASLDRYIEENKAFYGLDTSSSFSDAAAKYDDDWFKTNQLVVAVVEEGSGSISHEVQWILKDKVSKCCVIIDRHVPEVGTADMAHWHILLEIERVKLPYELSYPTNLTKDFDIQVRLFTVRER